MISVEQLKGAVGTYSGNVSFTIPLASLADTGDKQYLVQAVYNSNVSAVVASDNYRQPTGVLGLGWSLDFERIVAVKDWSATISSVRYYYLEDGGMNEMVMVSRVGAQRTYVLKGVRAWAVTYDEGANYWIVVKEDGSTYTFGDPLGKGQGVVQDVAWGGWFGFSAATTGQSTGGAAWHLTSIADLWQNTVKFSYNQTTVVVGQGGISFTRAVYLSTITGVTGQTAVFSYHDKASNEYGDPALPVNNVNAWQYQFETKYLDSVTTQTPTGDILVKVVFDYTDTSGAIMYIGTGKMAKRCLTGATRMVSGLYSVPKTMFGYVTDASFASLGSIASVTNEDGGIVEYSYQTVTATLSERKLALKPPVKTGVTYTNPRFWFQNRTVLITWLGSDNIGTAVAYRWEGQWLSMAICSFPSASLTAYNAVAPALTDESIGLAVGGKLYAFMRDVCLPGNWVGDSAGIQLDLTTGEAVISAASRGFIAVLGGTSGKLNTAWFNGSQWSLTPTDSLQGTNTGIVCAVGAANNYIVAASASTTTGGTVKVTLKYMDELGVWNFSSSTVVSGLSVVDGVSVDAMSAYAGIGVSGPASPNRSMVYYAAGWNQSYGSIALTELFRSTYSSANLPPTPFVTNSCVTIGGDVYRYDGSQWNYQDLSATTYSDTASVTSTFNGYDCVVRTLVSIAGGTAYDLLQYNPASTAVSGRWAAPSNMANVPAKTGTSSSAKAANGGERSDYVLFNNAVYYKEADATFSKITDITETLSPAESASLSLLASNYVLYQSGSNTCVYMLANGGITGSKITLTGEQVIPPTADVGQGMAGDYAFVTYVGSWTSSAPTLFLHCAVNGAVQGKMSPACIQKVTVYPLSKSGVGTQPVYGVTNAAYYFEGTTAAMSPDGWAAAYNKAISAENCTLLNPNAPGNTPQGTREYYYFNGNLGTFFPSIPYPVDATNTNAASYLALLKGTLYLSRIYKFAVKNDTPTLILIGTETQYLWVYQTTPSHASKGYYSRMLKKETMLDNVVVTVTSAYNSTTGQAQSVTTSHYTAEGLQQTMVRTFTYFWQQYDPAKQANLLTPVVRIDDTTDGVLTGVQINTWKNSWGVANTNWAEWGNYAATSATPSAFNQWSDDSIPLATGWILRNKVTARNSRGLPAASTDTIGRIISLAWDSSDNYNVAVFQNADTSGQEACYYGFEVYETNNAWSYLGGVLSRNIVSGEAHAGTRSLQIPSNTASQSGPTATFVPTGQKRKYIFSSWIQTPSGFNSAPGSAQWTISIYTVETSPRKIGSDIVVAFTETGGNWQYFFQVIDLAKIRTVNGVADNITLSVTVFGYNQKTGLSIQPMVDNLRWSPLDGVFNATAFEADTFLPLAKLGENGQTEQVIRDVYKRVVGSTGPGAGLTQITINTLARDISGSDSLNPSFPNSRMDITSAQDGGYYNFEASDSGAWNLPTDWQMAGGKLSYSGTGGTPPLGSQATLKTFGYTSFAAYVKVYPGATVPNTGVGATNVYVYWDQGTTRWNVCYLVNGQPMTVLSKLGPGYRNDMLLVIMDGLLTFFADGTEVFTFQLPSTIRPDGTFFLSFNGGGAFGDLLVAGEPRLKTAFLDGTGRNLQSLVMRDGSTLVAAGRLAEQAQGSTYEKNYFFRPIVVNTNMFDGGVGSYLPDDPSGGGQLSLSQYLSTTGGYLYNQDVYEASPLRRKSIEAGAGATFAVPSGNTIQYKYQANSSTGPMSGVVPDGVAGNFFLTTTTDENGVLTYALTNTAGQGIAERRGMEGGGSLTSMTVYNPQGQVQEIRPPNYFAPPSGTTARDWATSLAYDFNERLLQTTTPDGGTTKLKYDSVGRERFTLNATGATFTPVQILYKKYDALNRVYEEGYLQNAAVTWDSLDAHLDDQTWPDTALSPVWNKQIVYDYAGDDASNALYSNMDFSCLVGRVWKTSVNCSGTGVTVDAEAFSYDIRGNISVRTSTLGSYGVASFQSQFAYDNLGELIQTTYPRKLGTDGKPIGTAFTVYNTYDRLGNLLGVGTLASSDAYAGYTYNPDGSTVSETLNNVSSVPIKRNFTYNTPGWTTAVAGDFIQESISYDKGGYCGVQYYDGNAAAVTTAYNNYMHGQTPDPFFSQFFPTMGWKYKYDYAGRLQVAEFTEDQKDRSYSIGADPSVVIYDPNGNMLSVPRGEATQNYAYSASGTQLKNRVNNVDTPLALTLGITSTSTLAPGWTGGASNKGTSLSCVEDSGSVGNVPPDAKAYKICGGSAAHYEFLNYAGYLDARGSAYSFSFWYKTDAGFDQQNGSASWQIQLCAAAGVVAEKEIASLGAGAQAWTQFQAVTVDLSTILSGMGLDENIVSFRLVLRNTKQGAGGAQGATAWVTTVSFSGTGTTGAYSYDAIGNTTAAPAKSIGSLTFDPYTNLPTGVTVTGPRSATLSFNYFGNRKRSSESLTVGTQTITKLHLYGNDGRELARYITESGVETGSNVIWGASGAVAEVSGSSYKYFITDRLGSVCAVADQGANLLGAYKYGPFGELTYQPISQVTDKLYTGQGYDSASGLYDYQARLYDASLRRFYAADVVYEFPTPFAYVGNDPINRTDPTGESWEMVKAGGVRVHEALFGLIMTPSDEYAENWQDLPEITPTGQGIYSPEDLARHNRCASALGLEVVSVKSESKKDDFLRGRHYAPANFAYARQNKGQDGRIIAANYTGGANANYTGGAIYTLDENMELRVFSGVTNSTCKGQAVGDFVQLMAHSQLAGGKNVYSAGWMWLENGKVARVNTASGHYVPPSAGLFMVKEVLSTLGIDVMTTDLCDFDQKLKPEGKCTFTPGKSITVERGRFNLDDKLRSRFIWEWNATRTRLVSKMYNTIGYNDWNYWIYKIPIAVQGTNTCVLDKPIEMLMGNLPY